MGGAIFIEEENSVQWVEFSEKISDLVMDIWTISNADRSEAESWIYMKCEVRGGRFYSAFVYPGTAAAGSEYEDWEDAAVAERFGDKPVVYPPMLGQDGREPA